MEKEPLYMEHFLRPLNGYDFVTEELLDAAADYDIQTIEQLYPMLKGKRKEELEKLEEDMEISRGTLEKFVIGVESIFFDNSSSFKLKRHKPSGGRGSGSDSSESGNIKRKDIKYKPK